MAAMAKISMAASAKRLAANAAISRRKLANGGVIENNVMSAKRSSEWQSIIGLAM
jgi:hypothetical protein